jgi:hypothetical protein
MRPIQVRPYRWRENPEPGTAPMVVVLPTPDIPSDQYSHGSTTLLPVSCPTSAATDERLKQNWGEILWATVLRRASSSAADLPLNGLVHERSDRLACLDDIRRQHPPGFRAEVSRIMRGPRGDQESIPRVQ